MEILSLKNVSFSYPDCDKKAVDNVTLSIEEGDFVVLCGATGCGKTTLLRLIKKELTPYGNLSGELLFRGENIESMDAKKSACAIGFVM